MLAKAVTGWEAVGIGSMVAIVASAIVFVLAFGVYVLPFVFNFTCGTLPLCILGALVGKMGSGTRLGSLMGAVITAFLGGWLVLSFISMIPID